MGAIHLEGLLPGPGPFQALLVSALLRQDPASGLWTGPLACLLPPIPFPAGSEGPSLPIPPPCRMGSCDTSPSFPEAARRPPRSPRMAAPALPTGRDFCSSSHPFASTARAGPTGIPDHTGELSDTEALSSPSVTPQPSHQQVFHHPGPRAHFW